MILTVPPDEIKDLEKMSQNYYYDRSRDSLTQTLAFFFFSWSTRSDYGRGGGGGGADSWDGRPTWKERGSYGGKYRRDGDQSYAPRRDENQGYWKDGVHHVGNRNPRAERELFGAAEDLDRQHTGINFEKYDDIPVEASGNEVPDAITSVSEKK
jgi:ATP-dependent RNA helicase DDX3X